MARENFYLILELPFDPPQEDPAVIKEAIEKKRLEWSKGSTDFKKGPIYRAYLSMLPEIKEVMSDTEKRRVEYEQAYRITYDRVRHMLAIIEKRGFLYESEVESIAKRLQVEQGMVRKACNVRIVEGTPNQGAITKPAGADRFHVLQVYLDTVNKKDYYDFINYYGTMHKRLKDMPTYRLLELVQNLKIMYPKNTPEESAIEKLCAECEKTFATKESKQEYDEYLIWKNTEEIFEQVQVASELTKVLDESQFEEAVKLLTEVIEDKERSSKLIEDYCKQNGIALDFVTRTRQESGACQPNAMQDRKKRKEEKEYVAQPNMPINLKVQVDTIKRCNHITWEKTTMDSNVNYLIVRKRGMQPRHINDGELLGTVSSSSYTDATIFPGKLYYYGVFAVKRGVYSKGICTQVGYINLFEVQDATITIKDGAAYLAWVQNYRECRVVIFRQEGNAPMDYGEGKMVYSAGHMSFKDTEIKEGSTYYYRIFTTIYVNGRRYHSKGIVISATVAKEKKIEERVRPIITRKAVSPPEPKEYRPIKSARPAWNEERSESRPSVAPRPPVLNQIQRKDEQEKEEYPVLTSSARKKTEEIREENKEISNARELFEEHAPTQKETTPLPKRKPGPYMKPRKKAVAKNSLLYQIKVRKGIFKPKGIEIVVEAEEDSFELPPLLIVASKGYPPAYKEAGSLIGTIEKQSVVKSCSHTIPLAVIGDNDYIKLFFANEADEGQYELHLKYGESSKFTK